MNMVIEVGMFGVKQLYVLQDLHVVLLGAETEGDTTVADRLAYYVFSGTDVRDRTAFADVQTSIAPLALTRPRRPCS